MAYTDQANSFGAFTQTFGGALVGTSATFSSTLGVTGASTLTGGFSSGANSSVTGTFSVSGATTLTGGALLPNGSAGTPAQRFTGDTDTGLYWISANRMGLSAGGTLRLAVGSANVTASVPLVGTSTLGISGLSTLTGGFSSGANSSVTGTFSVSGLSTLTGGAAFGGTARSSSWASRTSGWGLDTGGSADFRAVFADEGHYKRFVSDLQVAHNGSQTWVKSVVPLGANFTCPALGGTATLTVQDFPSAPGVRVFSANDYVVLAVASRTDGDSDGSTDLAWGLCVGVVTSYADSTDPNQTWTFTRGSGANGGGLAASTVIPATEFALDFGVSNAGYAEVTINDGAEGVWGPYVQTGRWATSPIPANRTVTTRMGNLLGITGTAGYGLFAGPQYAATNGRYLIASDAGVDIHGARLRLWEGSSTAIELNPNSGNPYIAVGNPAPTSFSSGNGFWCGDDSGTYKCRVGNPAGPRWEWNGSSMTIAGDGSAVTNVNGANIQTGSVTATQIAAGTITATQLSVTVAGPNLVPNGSIEVASGTGLPTYAVYSNSGTVTSSGRTTAEAWDGGASWQTTWSGTNTTTKGVTCPCVTPAWKAGETYVMSFYAKTATTISPAGGMFLGWNTAPATTVTLANPNLTTSWQRYVFRLTWGGSVEANGVFFVSIANAANQAANTIYIDAISVTRGETVGGYAPFVREPLPGSIYADSLIAGTISGFTINSSSFNIPGQMSLNGTYGISLKYASSSLDYARQIGWGANENSIQHDKIFSTGAGLRAWSETGRFRVDANELFDQSWISLGDGPVVVEVGSNYGVNGAVAPSADGALKMGTHARRWGPPHFDLVGESSPTYIVTGGGSTGTGQTSELKYTIGWTGTRNLRNSAGTAGCTLVYVVGILTGGTC
ncbi:MAG: hypothetical protein E6R03_16100 [Hyphomicrobiaceae bacterium]|nr:MAG: hypothetical protein E6R03_16100 [Hyphomicrobiaceae bacterium]